MKFGASSTSSAHNALVIVIKSGIVYCAVQLVRMVLYSIMSTARLQSATFYIYLVITSLASSATAVYPTVVNMFLIQLENTLRRNNEYATSDHILFTSRATTHNDSFVLGLSEISAPENGPDDIEMGSLAERESNSAQQTRPAPF